MLKDIFMLNILYLHTKTSDEFQDDVDICRTDDHKKCGLCDKVSLRPGLELFREDYKIVE